MSYPIIDAHQHFWKFDPLRDGWITDEMSLLKRDFLPEDLEKVLLENNISGTVVVQSDRSETENHFQLALANQNPFIKGVVGWIDLHAPDIDEKLSELQKFKKLKGFREVLQGDLQRDRMLQPSFQNGISLLQKYGYTYDLLILPDQLGFAKELVSAFPGQRFVIDHLAKPPVRKGEIAEWEKEMSRFADDQQVFCKISGMITEANWQNWKPDDFLPYMDAVVRIFGTKRIMFGSDWPVCLLAGTYSQVKQLADLYFSSFSQSEQEDFFGANAVNFYQLNPQ